jgi:hypothetical protein
MLGENISGTPDEVMFSDFRPTPGGTPTGTLSSSASVWENLRGWSAFPNVCSKSSYWKPSRPSDAEAYHLHRTRLELIAERKVRRRQLTDDGNVEITGRDLREREIRARHPRPIGYRRAAS